MKRSRNLNKKIRNFLENVFAWSFIVGIFAFPGMVILGAYSFFKYPESFFTTDPNFMSLSEVAPVLHNLTIAFTVVAALCVVICLSCQELCEYLYKKNKRR